MEHFDVIIVGAGLSGIGAGYHLQTRSPGRRYLILEGREAVGGTWDLFRYPGIRSDSDMYTLGYAVRPWTGEKANADGPSVLPYLRATPPPYRIDRRVRLGWRGKRPAWSAPTAPRWSRLTRICSPRRMMSFDFRPLMLATKPTPHASCSLRGSYNPWASGSVIRNSVSDPVLSG